ncbi:type II/IV secretion system protein [bacterium]|nr:type II/IV secretion system protein [bacterium]
MATLLDQLVQKGLLDKKKAASLEYEIKTSGQREEEVILKHKIVSEIELFNLKSESLKIPLKQPSLDNISPDVLKAIPEDSATFYKMIPLAKKGKLLEVGMVYPEDLKSQEALKFLARRQGIDYKIFLVTPTFYNQVLQKYRTLRREVGKALEELETEIKPEETKKAVSETELKRLVEEAPIAKIVAVILRHAVEGEASDIHIEPTREKIRVRFRLDGVLHSSIFLPLRIHPAIVARIKILSRLKLDESRVPQDGRFSIQVGDNIIDFRVSTFPTNEGEKVAIRVLDPRKGMKTLHELGFRKESLAIIEEAIKKPYGAILATGPTGCGKTTTLYAILRKLNKEGVNIVTLEDPIEYYIEGINQSQIRPEIGYTFASGLRTVVRQDPDIIMVGEIRDSETASLATHAALTGHLVLSTLHTNSSVGVVPRLIDLGVERYLVPSTLNIAIAQRLVRKLCPYCKKKIEAKGEVKKLIMKEINNLPGYLRKEYKKKNSFFIYKPQGCQKCRQEGYIGRVAVAEVLKMTERLSEIILTNPSEGQIAKEAQRQGMITMRQDGILKVLEGVTSIEEVLRVTAEV